MKERPILFSGAMVRALLAGTKTQTRRVVKPQPSNGWAFETPPVLGRITSTHTKRGRFGAFLRRGIGTDFPETDLIPCPYGQPGDRLWVRETFRGCRAYEVQGYAPSAWGNKPVWFEADGTPPGDAKAWALRARPSIHMPRWASRITLEVTSVRVERLQDIDLDDALAEGISDTGALILDSAGNEQGGPIAEYAVLWEQINGPGSWDANPWVWVIEFKRVEGGAL